jgi:hypothetical protein
MTMRTVRTVLGGLVLVCSSCAAAPPSHPAAAEAPPPSYSDQTPYAGSPASYQWTGGWAHLRL